MTAARFTDVSRPPAEAVFWLLTTLTVSVFLAAAAHPFGVAEPWLPAIVLYFWATRHPGLAPPLLSFAAGLMLDLLSGGPLGLWALSLTGLTIAARLLRPAVEGAALWKRTGLFAAALATMIVAAAVGLSASGSDGQAPFLPMLTHALATLILYPVAELALAFLAKRSGLGKGAAP